MDDFFTTIWNLFLGASVLVVLVIIFRLLSHSSVTKFLLIFMGISLFFGDDDDMDC